jgi:hypothetical protein
MCFANDSGAMFAPQFTILTVLPVSRSRSGYISAARERCTGGFDNEFRGSKQQPHRIPDLIVAHEHDFVHEFPIERERSGM